MSAELEDLLALQVLDTSLDQVRYRRSHLPERSDLADLDRSLAAVAVNFAAIQMSLDEVSGRQSAVEADLASTEARSEAINKRLYAGDVVAARDLQAMSGEVEHLRTRASSLEDAVLELMDERESIEAAAAELRSSKERLTSDRAAVAARLADTESALDGEIASLAERRDAASAAVSAPLLDTYERLRARLGGVGIARLVANRCDGCHLTLSAVELDKVRHLPEGQLYFCEQCSRILVP